MQLTSLLQPTAIPSFDTVLHGGIPTGSTILVAGQSGAGKTMFCAHWLFAGFKEHKEKGLYISLTEPISKLQHHQSKMSYYNKEYVDGKDIEFTDLRTVLEHEGLDKGPITKDGIQLIIQKIADMVLAQNAKRVVLDSVTALCYRLETTDLIRHFIFSLGTTLAYLDATILLTSEVQGAQNSVFGTEEFICDGIFRFGYDTHNERVFQVVKLRGHEYTTDQIKFTITKDGVQLYPTPHQKCEEVHSQTRMSFGIDGVNTMMNGGYFTGSSVAISGPTGSGKTVLALHAAAAALQAKQNVLFVSFDQSKQSVLHMAQSFGLSIESDRFHIVSPAVDERYIEAHIYLLQQAIEKGGITVVVLDSLTALRHHYSSEVVLSTFKKFISYCKNKQVSLVLTNTIGSFLEESEQGTLDCSDIVDTVVLLRFIEIDSTLRQGIMIQKMRASEHAKRMMELTITAHGPLVTNGFAEYTSVMTGEAKKASRSALEKIHSLYLEEFGAEGEALFAEQKAVGVGRDEITAFVSSLSESGLLNAEQKKQFLERAIELLQ